MKYWSEELHEYIECESIWNGRDSLDVLSERGGLEPWLCRASYLTAAGHDANPTERGRHRKSPYRCPCKRAVAESKWERGVRNCSICVRRQAKKAQRKAA